MTARPPVHALRFVHVDVDMDVRSVSISSFRLKYRIPKRTSKRVDWTGKRIDWTDKSVDRTA